MAIFLKRLELHGFKSFADKTSITFSDGATSLLGPNGCGKSNVVDAIKWVLGAKKKSDLRAKDREDVIFNGTAIRKPMSAAEVTLVISNEEGQLPSTDASEVEIKRRIERNGNGTDYYINGEKAKAGDIQNLFMDTGVGKSAYSILEQGKIGQIVESSAENRRMVFDEAAGITRHKKDVEDAKKKIESTQKNLETAELLMNEHKRVYDRTKTQAEKAKLYKELKVQSDELEIEVKLSQLQSYILLGKELNNQLTNNREKRSGLEKEIEELNELIRENDALIGTKRARRDELVTQNTIARSNIQSIETLVSAFTENYNSAVNNRRSLAEKASELQESIDENNNALVSKRGRRDYIQENVKSIEEEILTKQGEIQIAKDQIIANRAEIESCESDIERAQDEIDSFHEKMSELADKIVDELDANLTESGYSTEERQKMETAVINALKELNQHLLEQLKYIDNSKKLSSDKILSAYEKHVEFALDKVGDIKGNFQEYSGSIPLFLDELISPDGIITQKRELDSSQGTAKETIISKKSRIVELKEDNVLLEEKQVSLDGAISQLREDKEAANVKLQEVKGEIELLEQDNNTKGLQLSDYAVDIETLDNNIFDLIEKIKSQKAKEQLENDKIEANDIEIRSLESEVKGKGSNVDETRKKRDEQVAALESIKESLIQIETKIGAIPEATERIKDDFFKETGKPLDDYEYKLSDDLKDYREYQDELISIKTQIGRLGSINQLAEIEFEEAKEKYEFFSTQIEDLTQTMEDLEEVHRKIVEESTTMFLESFAKVTESFKYMFSKMFGAGGFADLALDNPEDVLYSGINITAHPPGKKLDNLNSLSGGEKSMVGVAIIFGIYLVKPSPFCILDEVDAALDDANVGYFLAGLEVFKNKSQFIIITHNKHTVTGTNSLLGVSMQEKGVTMVVSYKKAELEDERVILNDTLD